MLVGGDLRRGTAAAKIADHKGLLVPAYISFVELVLERLPQLVGEIVNGRPRLHMCAARPDTVTRRGRVHGVSARRATIGQVASTAAAPRGEEDKQTDDATDAAATCAKGANPVPLAVGVQAIFLFFAASAIFL